MSSIGWQESEGKLKQALKADNRSYWFDDKPWNTMRRDLSGILRYCPRNTETGRYHIPLKLHGRDYFRAYEQIAEDGEGFEAALNFAYRERRKAFYGNHGQDYWFVPDAYLEWPIYMGHSGKNVVPDFDVVPPISRKHSFTDQSVVYNRKLMSMPDYVVQLKADLIKCREIASLEKKTIDKAVRQYVEEFGAIEVSSPAIQNQAGDGFDWL